MTDAPNSIQLEPTEGCNLRCGFCGIHGIRSKGPAGDLSGPYKFMTLATAQAIAGQLLFLRDQQGWNPRIEIAMHGEPTMNPALLGIVSLMRKAIGWKGYMLMTTNGIPLLGDFQAKVDRLFAAGLNTIAIDDYRPHPVREAFEAWKGSPWKARHPADPEANPHRRETGQRLILVEDISQADTGNHSHLSNHAGCAAEPDYSMQGEKCALPFREMSIRWDGSIALCCNDWRGTYRAGHVDEGIQATWEGEAFGAARRKLYAGERDFGPCHGCNHRTYRNGLLPDRMGRDTMGPPTEADAALIDHLANGTTLTPVVLRRWEKK